MIKNIFLVFIIIICTSTVFAQTKKEYKPKKRVITSVTNNKIRRTIVTSTPHVKEKQVAVITTVNKDGVPTKSFLTYQKRRIVHWKTKRKNVYLPVVK